MRVTPEMVERAMAARGYGNEPTTGQMRRALEAALADVPEPDVGWHEEWEEQRAENDVLRRRAQAAEAQLARVQEVADALVGGVGNTLRAILDGEP